MKGLWGLGIGVAVLAAACGSNRSAALVAAPGERHAEPQARPSLVAPATPRPSPISPTPGISPAVETDGAAVFHGTIQVIGPVRRARMSWSWRPGCPVPIRDLRLLTLDYRGFDGAVHRGEMVVNKGVAADVVSVFRALFDARFPIRRMKLVDVYGGDDDRSMAADNTSAFNCRSATGHPGVWSEHSYGWAIDINPVENPYVSSGGSVAPPAGARHANRSATAPGMIQGSGVVVRAFAAVGWGWGGSWQSIKDYQHFSATGR